MTNAEAYVEGPAVRAARNVTDLTIIAQDPSVRSGPDKHILTARAKVPAARLEPGPRTPRFYVVDYDASTGTLVPAANLPPDSDRFAKADDKTLTTDFAFHAQQVYAVAARTLATFESALGRRLPWGFAGHQPVPRAARLQRSERLLLVRRSGPAVRLCARGDDSTIYTCLSHDVVVHETTHAVLDGLRHRFLEPGLPDQAGFHEGFADIVALLSVFSLRTVVEVCLELGHHQPPQC